MKKFLTILSILMCSISYAQKDSTLKAVDVTGKQQAIDLKAKPPFLNLPIRYVTDTTLIFSKEDLIAILNNKYLQDNITVTYYKLISNLVQDYINQKSDYMEDYFRKQNALKIKP